MKTKLIALLLLIGTSHIMAESTEDKETKWYTGKHMYEGFPLHLRFPEKPDFDAIQKKYTKLLVVTHKLAKVQRNGEPTADYNSTLADFDQKMIVAFRGIKSGLTVLVETFGGKRAYYMYVAADAPVEAQKRLFAQKYPEHKLSWELSDGKGCKLIRSYAKDYKFYEK